MPPFLIPPLLKFVLGALGAGAAIGWVVKEVRRLNREIDKAKAIPGDPRPELPTLRRDPDSDEWRVK
jgi:hypothetical protein